MRSGRRESARRSGEVFLEPGVGGLDQLVGSAVEDDLAFIQDEKFRAVVDSAIRDWFDLSGLLIETVSGQEEGVLQAMRDYQRRCVADVALFDDEIDDGGRCDGIESTGGGVVKDEVRLGDDGAGDGDAASHSAGELGRKLRDRLLEFNESEGLDDSLVCLFFGDVLFVEAIGHVVFYGEGIEECRLLKDHADTFAQLEEIGFPHLGDVFAKDANGA
jgi:hypothetical protein